MATLKTNISYDIFTNPSTIWFDIILLLLAGVAGSIDVMSYFGLGHVFTANMTGNTIMLGLSIGQGKLSSSLHSLAALAGFISGAFLGAFMVESKAKNWNTYITRSIAVEGFIIVVFALLWYRHNQTQDDFSLYISIILSAIAMGLQSAAIRHLHIPGVVTTFITGTITSIGASAAKGLRQGFKQPEKESIEDVPVAKNLEQRIHLQIMVFVAYLLTAVFTGWIENHVAGFLPVLPLLLIIGVLVILLLNRHTIPNY